jgi:hypothetical protein
MKSAELKPFKVGYGDEKIVFHPRMATVAEVDDVNQQLNDIADSDDQKYQKDFDIRITAISEWSAEAPQKLVKIKGEFQRQPLIEDAESTLDAMKRFFGDRTPENERVIRAAYNAYNLQFNPEIDFL